MESRFASISLYAIMGRVVSRGNFLRRRVVLISGVLFMAAPGMAAAQANANGVAQAVAPAKPDPFGDPLIKQIQARQEKAVKGDEQETKALTADLEKWTKEQPDNHLLQAYLGSVYTLDSRDAWPGPGKLTFLRNGGALMDAAVAAAPDNPAVRLVRAIDYFELPAIFGKRQTARLDFELLMKQIEGVEKSPYTLDVATQQAIYYYAGMSFYQLSDYEQAKDAWSRGLKLDPASELAGKITVELGKVR
jgi:tetratricopeptide (TPR) repeat protein